ncbi:MAG: methyltransferase domain-containing protein [Kiritimatiellae bacterium]|nr:methyltransferase domain-containing protein [Kiritimatiellia bacterium]
MPRLTEDGGVRASLEVGFGGGALPEAFSGLRGRVSRSIDGVAEFPFEDAQFDVVLMAGRAVSRRSVKEAHRVLKPEGCLHFIVMERTKSQEGFTLPQIYSVVRDGFNIVDVVRPAWWRFGSRGRTITICAQKKNWRPAINAYRPYV